MMMPEARLRLSSVFFTGSAAASAFTSLEKLSFLSSAVCFGLFDVISGVSVYITVLDCYSVTFIGKDLAIYSSTSTVTADLAAVTEGYILENVEELKDVYAEGLEFIEKVRAQ